MKRFLLFGSLTFALIIVLTCHKVSKAQSNEIQTRGKVCPDPSSPCGKAFGEADLSFKLPAKMT